MIEISFTCEKCGIKLQIEYDDVEEKRIVPVCEPCYNKFENRKDKLIRSLQKLYAEHHIDCPYEEG